MQVDNSCQTDYEIRSESGNTFLINLPLIPVIQTIKELSGNHFFECKTIPKEVWVRGLQPKNKYPLHSPNKVYA